MITNAVRLLIICVFAFVPLLLGEFARNKAVNNTNDFILQGRKLKTLPMYATIFSTWMSIFAFIGAIAYFYEQGPIYMTTVGWDALFAVLFILLGRRIWHYGKVHNYMTPTDFFDDIYDSKKLNVLVTVVSILSTMVYLQVQIVGGILVMNVATAGVISSYVGGIIFFSILVIYLWAGGLRAVVMTDIFYGILIVLAIVSSGLYLMHVAGGTGQVFPELIAKDPSYVIALCNAWFCGYPCSSSFLSELLWDLRSGSEITRRNRREISTLSRGCYACPLLYVSEPYLQGAPRWC